MSELKEKKETKVFTIDADKLIKKLAEISTSSVKLKQ